MVTATPIVGPAAQHVKVATVGVHGTVAGRVDEVWGIHPGGTRSVHVKLSTVCSGLARTQPQPLEEIKM